MLISAVGQGESAPGTRMSPPPRASLPSRPSGLLRSSGLGSLHHTADCHQLSVSTNGRVCVSMLLSRRPPLPPSHTVSPGLFSMSASPWLPCKQVHRYHLKAAVSWGSGARTLPTEQRDRAFWTEASSTPWELVECGGTGDMDKPWIHAGNVRQLLSG